MYIYLRQNDQGQIFVSRECNPNENETRKLVPRFSQGRVGKNPGNEAVKNGLSIAQCGEIRNTGNFCLWNPKSGNIYACGIRNPELWKPEYSSRNPETQKFH